ncbi:flagellar basal body rod protein FlgB [Terrilactibacillus sp. BCM23-1]|uniref:Flagellar basal body rod protein FlgB n=1 Tax=Terrilactibacillus tamarindi TaxID=2599694 RepID=A0A6N8CTI6_9BACI|nr:flagellar basal body rod protein FlgB [Terrilactibacillus tamarindi]MTT32285.1 flagellar basal body rod protein FlgB [Terrilactibacillus tamarindi]
MDIFSNTWIPKIEKAMNRSVAIQNVTAQNVSNVDTPNYKAKQVVFQDELDHAMQAKKTETRHLSFSGDHAEYHIINSTAGAIQSNGNNVDIDAQMTTLAQNQIHYQALETAINHKFNQFKTVLGGN